MKKNKNSSGNDFINELKAKMMTKEYREERKIKLKKAREEARKKNLLRIKKYDGFFWDDCDLVFPKYTAIRDYVLRNQGLVLPGDE